jgi:hypothetical protein
MSAPIVIPFDNKPVSTQKGTGTYTCPAGKYALVTVVVSGEAKSTLSGGAPTTLNLDSTSGDFNESFSIWVNPGDTVSATLLNASGTTTTTGGTITSATGVTTVTVNHNSNPIGIFRAATGISVVKDGAGTNTITRSGSSSFHFYAQEYSVVS